IIDTLKNGDKRKLKLAIPYTIPGEKVEVEVDHKLKRRYKGHVTEIIEADEARILPRCPHFGHCGGCSWQHVAYDTQKQIKTEQVQAFLKEAGFNPDLVNNTIGMDTTWEYSNKMEFTFSPDVYLGLHELGNYRKIIPLRTSHIIENHMLEATLEKANWLRENELSGYDKETHTGLLRNVMVRRSQVTEEMMLAIFATKQPTDVPEIESLVRKIESDYPQVKSLLWLVNTQVADRAQSEDSHTLLGRDFIYDEMFGYTYRLWFDTFFQTNPLQAEKLVE